MEENVMPVLRKEIAENSSGGRKFLYFSAMIANMAMLTAGSAYSWSSPSLPKLNGQVKPEENPLPYNITTTEESLIASLVTTGAIVSPFMVGVSADKFGRKATLIYSVVPIFMCFAIKTFANRLWHFYLARLLAGFGVGGIFLILPNYIAEIAEKHNRGILSCLSYVCLTLGNLLIYAVGPYLTIQNMSLLLLIPPTLFFLIFTLFVPESPYFLVAQHKEAEAATQLAKLRGKSSIEVQNELLHVRGAVYESFENKMKVQDLFTDKGLIRGLAIIFGLLSFQQVSGINIVILYMQNIFEASGTSLAPETSVLLVGIARFLSSLVAPLIVESLGRKVLLHVSSIGLAISLAALGAFFLIKDAGVDHTSLNWLPVSSLVAYIFAYNIGLGPLPWSILGELFPQNLKAAASTISVSFYFLETFGTALLFPLLMEIIGSGQSFVILAVLCATTVVFTHFCVPETKGKTLVEVQNMLKVKQATNTAKDIQCMQSINNIAH